MSGAVSGWAGEAFLQAGQAAADHRSVPVVGQCAECGEPGGELISRLRRVALAEVTVTEVEVQARGEARRGRDAYRREVGVMDVNEGGEGLLVPGNLGDEVVFEVGQVVSEDAPLSMIGLGGADPAGMQVVSALSPVATEGYADRGLDVVPLRHNSHRRRRSGLRSCMDRTRLPERGAWRCTAQGADLPAEVGLVGEAGVGCQPGERRPPGARGVSGGPVHAGDTAQQRGGKPELVEAAAVYLP